MSNIIVLCQEVLMNAASDSLNDLEYVKAAIHQGRGFLPLNDPIESLPNDFSLWDDFASDLPKLMLSSKFRSKIEHLPIIDVKGLSGPDLEFAMLRLSFLGHAYVWAPFQEPAHHIPKSIAVPWFELSRLLGRHPILSYASYALHNWRRFDKGRPIELGNITLIQNFLGGLDEEWFVLVHVDIEAKAALALRSGIEAQYNILHDDPENLFLNLTAIVESLEKMYAVLLRMPEGCDPYMYYNRVRPYIHGFTHHPVVYEGVEEYAGKPQKFFGETGAQSTIIPFLDGVLGIRRDQHDEFDNYLLRMREYMPISHRTALEIIERMPSIRDYIIARISLYPGLGSAYNECLNQLDLFLAKHIEYAMKYIQKQSEKGAYNPTEVGTGGTPFMEYLKKHRERRKTYQIA